MPSTYTTHYNFEKPGYDEQDETWGYTADANYDAIDAAIWAVSQASTTGLAQASPPGTFVLYMGQLPPSGWLKANGTTIGSAASGATNRANADTEALFSLLWVNFDNATLPIQTSGGVATTRGASAAADFAANKRLPVPDFRDYFPRVWKDNLSGGFSGNIGVEQLDSMQRITGTVGTVLPTTTGGSSYSTSGAFSLSTSRAVYSGAGATARDVTFDSGNSAGARVNNDETRPKNKALLGIVKL